jgi:hypothetical protein
VSAPVPISVDPEFQALIPPLTHEEKTELENSLLREGCLDSIKVWKEGNILIDGHNRLDICTLHQIPYQLTYLSFPSRYAVVIWIITNQLGRRNVTKEQKSYLRGKRYEAEKKNIGGNYGNQYTKAIDQNDLKPNHTAENLAQEFNVSAPTIKRDAQFAKGVDLVGASNPALRERILSGQANIPKQDLQALSALTPPETLAGFDDEDDEDDEPCYDGGMAYCKYCYTTHDEWEIGEGFDCLAWICQRCNHATADDFMEMKDDETEGKSCYNCTHYHSDGHHETRYYCDVIGATFHDNEGLDHPYCHYSEEEPLVFQTEEDVLKRAAEIRRSKKPHVANNSGDNEWYTPKEFIEAARYVLGTIDLDPASSESANKIVQAVTFYTAIDNGLQQEWFGKVWMNPPYEAGLIDQFCLKLKTSIACQDVSEAIVLVNNATETQWFFNLISVASAVVFPTKRVRFLSPEGKLGSPLQGQALVYAGPHSQTFLETFASFGWGARL